MVHSLTIRIKPQTNTPLIPVVNPIHTIGTLSVNLKCLHWIISILPAIVRIINNATRPHTANRASFNNIEVDPLQQLIQLTKEPLLGKNEAKSRGLIGG